MPATELEEYMARAEECLRLAGACIAESNRQILIYAAIHWRKLAEEAAEKSAQRPKPPTEDRAPMIQIRSAA
jgi:hypothetical protein